MNGIITSRLIEMFEKSGISQSELARRVNLKQPSIGRLLTGETQKSGSLTAIARELGTTAEFLTGITDDPQKGALSVPTPQLIAEQIGAVMVPQLELGYSMGGGAFIDHAVEVGHVPFPRQLLKSIMKGGFEDLFVASGAGDSMEPTLKDNDIVLIDSAQKNITQQDKIWAISYGDMGMIKRIRRQPGGSYLVMSDNHNIVTPFDVHDEEMHVIGRVIWIGRWM